MSAECDGITIVITTWKRPKTLRILLNSLARQQTDFPTETFVVNNDPNKTLSKSRFTKLGRALRKVKMSVLLNSSENLGCSIRYPVAMGGRYSQILLLDDDIELTSPFFIQKMKNFLDSKDPQDIVSCWCSSFKTDPPNYFDTDPSDFLEQQTDEQEVDLIGPGISMFNKTLLIPNVASIPEKFRDVDNVWFSLMSTITAGTKKYYFPSFDMIRFTSDGKQPMFSREGMNELKQNCVLHFHEQGYRSIKFRTVDRPNTL